MIMSLVFNIFYVGAHINMVPKILLILILTIVYTAAKNEMYMGYKIYKVKFETEEQQNNLRLLKNDNVDFWRYPSLKHDVVGRAMVPPSHITWFEQQLSDLDINVDIEIEDLYEYLLEKDNNLYDAPREVTSREFDFTRYYRYDEILDYLRNLEESYSTSTSISLELVEFGSTYENRSLVYLKISNNVGTSPKPVVIVETAIIPRDWITIPTAINVVNNILDEAQPRFLNNFDWIVIPVVNPDGYEYTFSDDRFWSKSRSTLSNLGFICPGVNINRNFDIDWGVSGASSSPCSYIYAGVSPFSEIESRLIQSIQEEYGSRTRLYISLQNNGGLISYPWYYEKAATALFRQNHLLALDMVNAMNSSYIPGVASIVMDSASGTSSDYFRINGVLTTFNIDIVHGDDKNVVIPAGDIEGIVDDVWRGIVVAVDAVL